MSEPVQRPEDREGQDGESRMATPEHSLNDERDLYASGDPGQGELDLRLPEREAAPAEICRSLANQDALDRLSLWPHWPAPWLAVIGPRQCGLTTLSRDFARRTGVVRVEGDALSSVAEGDIAAIARVGIAVDDADRAEDGRLLLRLLNAAQEEGGTIVLFAHARPADWELGPADLASRLRATPVVEIGAPDVALMAARLQAAARAHFIHMDGEIAQYFAFRLARRYSLITPTVDVIAATLKQTGRRLTRPLAREILGQLARAGGVGMVPELDGDDGGE